MLSDDCAPEQLAELAADRRICARRADAAAADGERVAADPSATPLIRAQAAAAARYAREHAREYREEARTFAAGGVPEQYWGVPYTG